MIFISWQVNYNFYDIHFGVLFNWKILLFDSKKYCSFLYVVAGGYKVSWIMVVVTRLPHLRKGKQWKTRVRGVDFTGAIPTYLIASERNEDNPNLT